MSEGVKVRRRGSGSSVRTITVEEMKRNMLAAMVAGPIKALDLAKRVPEFCRKRGWPPDPRAVNRGGSGYEWFGAVVGAYKLKLHGQRMTVPDAFMRHERWQALVQQFGVRPTVGEIVEAMELDDLLGEEAKHAVDA